MELLKLVSSVTWTKGLYAAATLWLIYILSLAVFRLWFSPIAHLPGPKLAALTQYYEFYYDIILGGQYTFKILEMHEKYGTVVRISPWEVHVREHDFHSELYTGSTRPRNKWTFWAKQFGAPHSALATIDHNHHRLRRSALNPFFSTQSVRRLQPVIEERVDALLDRLLYHADHKTGQPLDAMYPFSAFTNDVINEYAFARCDHLIEEADFGAYVTDSLLKGTHMGPVIKHANWALTVVNALPEAISGRWVPGWGAFLTMKNDILNQIRSIKDSEFTEKWASDVSHPTIFHEMLSSKVLPADEKAPERLAQEGQILVQGGTLTTSWTLTLAVFHLLNRPQALKRLRDELFHANTDSETALPLSQLENLPYLRAVVKEALRHGIGTSGRLSRIAPGEHFDITDSCTGKVHHVPAGSVISMSPYMTVMDGDIFEDPTGFVPERWLAGGESLDKYLTVFGGGTRICLGMALAQAELFLMLSKLFRRWGSGGTVDGSEEGDVREGDVGVWRIFETTARDCQMASDYFIPIPWKGTKGVRFLLERS